MHSALALALTLTLTPHVGPILTQVVGRIRGRWWRGRGALIVVLARAMIVPPTEAQLLRLVLVIMPPVQLRQQQLQEARLRGPLRRRNVQRGFLRIAMRSRGASSTGGLTAPVRLGSKTRPKPSDRVEAGPLPPCR